MNRKVSVAPMMDCTDRHERYFLRLISKNTLLYTEMVVDEAIKRGDKKKLLEFNINEKPVALQLGGSSPILLAEASKIGEDFGYDEINLNLGCPSKKVEKNKFGACLMKEPNLVADCLSKMQASTNLPVTIKTRIGYDDVEDYENLHNFISSLKTTGVKTFIIHARKAMLGKFTPKQNLNIPPLKYDYVYKLKEDFPNEEIIINGGITTVDEIKLNDKGETFKTGKQLYDVQLGQIDPIKKEILRKELITKYKADPEDVTKMFNQFGEVRDKWSELFTAMGRRFNPTSLKSFESNLASSSKPFASIFNVFLADLRWLIFFMS